MLLSTDDMFFHINRKDPDFVRVIERCQGRLDSYISDLDNELYGLATKASGIMKRLIAAWGGGARTGGFETVTTDWGNCLLDVVELVYKTWNGLSMREMLVNHPADGLSGYQETGGANLWVEHEGDFMGNQAGEISDHQRVVRDMAIALGAGQQYLCFVYHALEDRSRGKDGGALLLDPAGIFGKWILPHNYVQEDPGFMTCAYILRDGILDLASKTRTAKALQPDCDDFRVLYLLLNARREAATRAWEGRFCCKNAASLNDSSTDVSADKQKGNGCWDTTVPVVAGQQRGVKRRTIEGTGVGGLDQQKTLGSVRDDANCVRSQGSSDGNPVAHHSFSVDKKEHLPQHAVEKRRNKPVEIDAIRIAFGKKLEYQDCKLSFDPRQNTLELSYEKRSMTTRRSQDGERASHDIDCKLTAEQLLEIKYFIDDENNDLEVDDEVVTNFLAVRVIKNRGNGLLQFSNAYKPDRGELEKRFIVAECRSDDELRELINAMKGQRDIMPFITAETKLTQVNKNDFCRALNEDDRRAVKRRAGLKKPRAGFIAGKGEEDTLVVFPFAGDANEIDGAANGLGRELSICLRQELPPGGGAAAVVEEMLDGSSSAEESVTGEDSGGGSAAVLSLRVMDFERLDPPEYLNDTLIDFWMKWMRRNTDASDIHIFTTLFYTTLVDEGTQAVANWTQKKKRPIRIFEKKLIFIPVNKGLHWSLCVVVNPGSIVGHVKLLQKKFLDESDLDKPFTCLLFLDSLRMHNMKAVGRNVREWLNAEWKRLEPGCEKGPFSNSTCAIISPTVPRQTNGYDCGVFVCRYSWGLFSIRSRRFSYREVGIRKSVSGDMYGPSSPLFRELITEDRAFHFTMEDIERLRREMKTLIEKLSGIYVRWKKQALKNRAERPAGKLARP